MPSTLRIIHAGHNISYEDTIIGSVQLIYIIISENEYYCHRHNFECQYFSNDILTFW